MPYDLGQLSEIGLEHATMSNWATGRLTMQGTIKQGGEVHFAGQIRELCESLRLVI